MNSRIFKPQRSTEAPMDFQFTSRPNSNVKPAWASGAGNEDSSTPKKRTHDDSALTAPSTPTFGFNQNVPFIFQTPSRQPPQPYPWAPPPNFSPSKAFPQPVTSEEVRDVDMSEVSPPKPEEPKSERGRPIATGGLRRVFRARQKVNGRQLSKTDGHDEEDDDLDSDEENDRDVTPINQNTSNHYTLNLPSPPAPQSDTPYILLGYLQFFFNLSLILVFLYLVVQFILTVQRDVEHRVSEYSADIIQEIAMCALQFKNNLCQSPLPAMAQQCANWETCMNRDPTTLGRARVGAELIAEVVNGFVEPISWKTLAFTLTSLSFLTVFINALLSLYRSRHHSPPHAPPTHNTQYPIHPSTPYPPHQFGGYLSPVPTPAWSRSWKGIDHDEDMQTPTRRRRLEGGGSVKIK
ncbi:Di-sulfide bridge nucleocytoplasmic transport domain-containing protein [Armillaria luteobubalina]|uniref:Di-sulfide bridge nucleocytoplasmic transport domain-containing protein n=1 Tax=Armillaria luteobubalina TaxID=153913 RepID=A0AA39QNX3_9AGAR|nr:Di-sulfide bridge nucleocytoplasmic transport domain-containing protein [Armillaria luteobubalina]